MAIAPLDQPAVTAAFRTVLEAVGEAGHSQALLRITQRAFWQAKKGERWADDKWGGGPKECMFPKCEKPPIRSHVIQRTRLNYITGPARNLPNTSSLATLTWSDGGVGARVNDNVSPTNASIFPGFCSEHDNKLFAEMEKPTAEGSEVELHMQACRSFYRELVKLQGETDYYGEANNIARAGEAEYLRAIFERELPGRQLSMYPELARMRLLKGLGDRIFEEVLDSKRRLREALKAIKPEVDSFIGNDTTNPFAFVELEVTQRLPLALSGVSPIVRMLDGGPRIWVPMFMVVLPTRTGPTRAFLFVSRTEEGTLREFTRQKGLIHFFTPRERARSTIKLIEQFLVTASDHWFLTPSFWNGLPSKARELILAQPSGDLGHPWKSVVLKDFVERQ